MKFKRDVDLHVQADGKIRTLYKEPRPRQLFYFFAENGIEYHSLLVGPEYQERTIPELASRIRKAPFRVTKRNNCYTFHLVDAFRDPYTISYGALCDSLRRRGKEPTEEEIRLWMLEDEAIENPVEAGGERSFQIWNSDYRDRYNDDWASHFADNHISVIKAPPQPKTEPQFTLRYAP